jgi:hypothetical protein
VSWVLDTTGSFEIDEIVRQVLGVARQVPGVVRWALDATRPFEIVK